MIRTAIPLTAALLLVGTMLLAGCAERQTSLEPRDDTADRNHVALDDLEPAEPPPSRTPEPRSRPQPRDEIVIDTGDQPAREPEPRDEILVPTDDATTGRVHVVKRGDSLYQLARQYYGDYRQWKTIYEANRSRLPNADTLPVGTKLIIP